MPKKSLKQIAYTSIKQKILNCEYEPNSFLNEDLLCEEYKVSRTPIRDALGRLEQEHLITILPKKGFFVSPLSIHEINMVFEGRLLIEPYIIQTYCNDFPSSSIDAMYANVELARRSISLSSDNIYDLDNKFHQYIISRCSNRYILQTYQNIHDQNCRLRILSGRANDQRLNDTLEEHIQILGHLSKNNAPQAAEAMKTHLANSKVSSFHAFMDASPIN